ncbi:hypothetical protein D3C87_1890330 [compost metagenome]
MSDDADAAGIGGEIAADLAGAARTEIDRQQEACIVGGALGDFERRAGKDGHGGGKRVDFLDAHEKLKREGNSVVIRVGAASKAGQAALDHDRLSMGVADAKHG